MSNDTYDMSPAQTKRVLLGLGLATWMEFYTFDAVNLVLPDMAGSFAVSQDEASWILTTFLSALFLTVPLTIWLAGHVSHLRYIIACALLFVAASLGCAVAESFPFLLICRGLQGFAGAGLAMWWRASIYLFIPRPQRSTSLMRISVMLYLSTAAGLMFSGWVTDNFSWRFIFVPNVVFVASAIWLLKNNFPKIDQPTDHRSTNVDGMGIALLGVSLVSLQILLSRGEVDGWWNSSAMQGLAWTSALALLCFIGWQLNSSNHSRLLRLDLVANRHVFASIVLGVVAGLVLTGSVFALPEFLRHVSPKHATATRTGLVLCTYALMAASIRPLVTKSIGRWGQRKALTFALVMLACSMFLMAHDMTIDTPDVYYILPLVLYAFCLTPLLSAVGGGTVAKLSQDVQLDAVSVYMTFRQFGAAVGVTLISVVIDQRERFHSSRLIEHLHSGSAPMANWLSRMAGHLTAAGLSTEQAHAGALKLLSEAASRQASTLAYADAFTCMGVIGVLSLALVPLMAETSGAKR